MSIARRFKRLRTKGKIAGRCDFGLYFLLQRFLRSVSSLASNTAGVLHEKLVFSRRAEVLSNWFAELVPSRARILDVGCGDGTISARLKSKRGDVEICGIDVLPRSSARISVGMFDGRRIPFADGSFDVVLFSDVLHHTNDPSILLREARRVARLLVVKDHFRKGIGASVRLRFMDWVGNARFGVALPYNYWTDAQWYAAWKKVGLRPEKLITKLGLYPPYASWIFEAQLHFIALLEKCASDNNG